MRCLSCNEALNDYESSRKTESGHYLDLCSCCYATIKEEIFSLGNPKLFHENEEDIEVLPENNDYKKPFDSDTYIDYNNYTGEEDN